ncbi:MAG: hypothetical protein NC489_37845 [Ruminococcus flavefaciens]|nr:hypothetical protein [Ruminococcus flavefaciens]
MMADQVESFIDGLIEKTKEGKLDWKPFSTFKEKREIIVELENGRGGFDYGVNSIRQSKSYFLQSGDGFVFIFEIYHGDPEVTSPAMDTIGLMVKINNVLPLDNLSSFGEQEQEALENLKLLIENYLEEKWCYPDVLYKFMSSVLED